MQLPDLDDLYAEIILDHYKRPRNKGLLDAATLSAEGFNPFCGDRVVLNLALDDAGRIESVGFEGEGCSISQASASIMTELLKGRTLDEASELNATFRGIMAGAEVTGEAEEELGELTALEGVKRFPVRIKCALLGWATLVDAIAAYRGTAPDPHRGPARND